MKKYNTALVTGGCQRIGLSIVKYLASKGLNIVVQYNNSSKEIRKIEKIMKEYNVKFHSFKFDFENLENLEESYKKIIKKIGKIDILINNASAFDYDSLDTSDFILFDRHINVNLKAPFFLSKYFKKNLGSKSGLIINLLDQRVNNITPYFTSYTISKFGLYALTKSLALSISPNIRVNGISPGPTLKSKNQSTKQFDEQVGRTPLKKSVKLSEINNAVGYLVDNSSITGEILTLDSGQSLGWSNTKSNKFKND